MRRPEVGTLAFAMLASACAIPTESPNWDMTWNVPVPDKGALSIPVSTFLPPGVTIDSSGATRVFVANLSGAGTASISRTLGADCTACFNGTGVKPAFTAAPPAATVSFASAASLTSAPLATGSQIVFAINNGYSFDPIRPQAGSATTNTGTLTLTVTNGTATLATTTILGTAQAIPPGQITTITVPLSGTISGSSPISVTMTMNSPQGSSVTMNLSSIFSIVGTPTIRISSATVSIAAQAVSAKPDPLDLHSIDSTIIRRISNDTQTRGTMFITLTNPFTVGGAMTMTLRSPAGTPASQAISPITKNVALTAAASGTTPNVSTVSLNFTGIELRSMLGHQLEAIFGGSTAAGSLTVTPTQQVAMSSRLQLNFNIKGQ